MNKAEIIKTLEAISSGESNILDHFDVPNSARYDYGHIENSTDQVWHLDSSGVWFMDYDKDEPWEENDGEMTYHSIFGRRFHKESAVWRKDNLVLVRVNIQQFTDDHFMIFDSKYEWSKDKKIPKPIWVE